jgi:hypothetical protein
VRRASLGVRSTIGASASFGSLDRQNSHNRANLEEKWVLEIGRLETKVRKSLNGHRLSRFVTVAKHAHRRFSFQYS